MTVTQKARPISHTGQELSRAVTFRYALDPNSAQRILLNKCAGARRLTVNHHLARVKTNLDDRSAEQNAIVDRDSPKELIDTPFLSWSGFSFINEFNAWKNGESDDSPINEDGADRFFASSKTCSGCCKVKSDLNLSMRTYSCNVCGLIIDRDLNAAINLARWRPRDSILLRKIQGATTKSPQPDP